MSEKMLITHHLWTALQKRGLSKTNKHLARFAREEDGVVTAMALFFVLMMCLVGGIGVDLMRNEMERTNVQATLDRAVLAASDMEQVMSPEGVVRDYFAKAGLTEFLNGGSVSVTDNMNTREVTAIARGTTKNMFMSVLGRTTLPIYGRSTAAEGVSNIEVSLVVDISGSMGGRKIEEMRTAASEFVDIVLDPSQAETVTVSLVPYNGKVNAGSLVNDYYTFSDQRLAANCVRFSATQFNMVGLQNNEHPERLARFDKNTGGWANSIQDPHCQTSDFGAILPWSNDPTELKTHINTLQAGGWTAIDLGMKWASILLDPTSQDELSAMATDGHVEPRFVGRPSNYYTPASTEPHTMKVVVLMTDGANTNQYDLKQEFKSGASDLFLALDPNGTMPSGENRYSVYDAGLEQYYWVEDRTWNALPKGADGDPDFIAQGLVSRVTNIDLFGTYPVQHIVQAFYSDPEYLGVAGALRASEIGNAAELTAQQTIGDANLKDICDVAKGAGVVVFAVAFEAPPGGQQALQQCASSTAHYFNAAGTELSTAFASIARQISALKLTQ
jgi:hypothetical protein